MKRFYDQFGWPPSEHNDDSFAAYQCGGEERSRRQSLGGRLGRRHSFDAREALIFP
jgi:hypothetical protein